MGTDAGRAYVCSHWPPGFPAASMAGRPGGNPAVRGYPRECLDAARVAATMGRPASKIKLTRTGVERGAGAARVLAGIHIMLTPISPTS
jgi:hypothetical protein